MIKAIVAGGAALILAVVGVGALGLKSAMDTDYQALDEEAQQAFLDGVARGVETGFEASAGGQAKITNISASAAADVIALDIKFTDSRVEQINGAATDAMKAQMYGQYCNYFAGQKLNDSGVTMKMRLMRPSGAPIATLAFNAETCAPHMKSTAAG